MARPTTKRRLRDIDPEAFGRSVAERVTTHLADFVDPHGDDPESTSLIQRHSSFFAKEASLLARYAMNGTFDGERAIEEAFSTIHTWLYSCAAYCGRAIDSTIDRDTNDDVSIIFAATRARLRLRRGESVPVRDLACLAGVDPDHIRLLARQGEIAIVSGSIAPAIARHWLEARGIYIT